MALDQIWKQQLTLVTYGNEYLTHDLSFQRWQQHAVFYQHHIEFRDLISQHLLAQHFQVWLEHLKKQGTHKISLHASTLLNQQQNPNANVELLPIAHFIVSHEKNKKVAWILGKELAEWYLSNNDFEIPPSQQSALNVDTFWRFELSDKFAKQIDADLKHVDWEAISGFIESELFQNALTREFIEPEKQNSPFYGINTSAVQKPDGTLLQDMQYLPLIPSEYSAGRAHNLLHRTEALSTFVEQKRQQPYHNNGEIMTSEEQINLRHFSEKLDDLRAKLIVKIANHYTSAQSPVTQNRSPLDTPSSLTPLRQSKKIEKSSSSPTTKTGSSGVIKLVLLTIIICACAYYFGF